MANECYNLISFWGNDQVMKQVEHWQKQLRNIDLLEDEANRHSELVNLFYAEEHWLDEYGTGSKWVVHDESSIAPMNGELGFRSAWNRPNYLERRMAFTLFKLDPDVIVRNDCNLEDNSRGVSYISPKSDKVVLEYEIFHELDQDKYDDIGDAAEALDRLIREEEIEAIADMICDKPSLVSVFMKFLPTIKIDWNDVYLFLDGHVEDDIDGEFNDLRLALIESKKSSAG